MPIILDPLNRDVDVLGNFDFEFQKCRFAQGINSKSRARCGLQIVVVGDVADIDGFEILKEGLVGERKGRIFTGEAYRTPGLDLVLDVMEIYAAALEY